MGNLIYENVPDHLTHERTRFSVEDGPGSCITICIDACRDDLFDESGADVFLSNHEAYDLYLALKSRYN